MTAIPKGPNEFNGESSELTFVFSNGSERGATSFMTMFCLDAIGPIIFTKRLTRLS